MQKVSAKFVIERMGVLHSHSNTPQNHCVCICASSLRIQRSTSLHSLFFRVLISFQTDIEFYLLVPFDVSELHKQKISQVITLLPQL